MISELPWLNSYRRKIGFVWHQRLADARPAVAQVVEALASNRANPEAARGRGGRRPEPRVRT
jgi:hypothetical protein